MKVFWWKPLLKIGAVLVVFMVLFSGRDTIYYHCRACGETRSDVSITLANFKAYSFREYSLPKVTIPGHIHKWKYSSGFAVVGPNGILYAEVRD